MRRRLGSLWLVLAVAVAVAVAGCGTTSQESYPTATAEGVADAIERGWLPEWLPMDASNIREAHDLDSNEVIVSFDSTDFAAPDDCARATDPPSPRLEAGWWQPPAQADVLMCGDWHLATESGGAWAWQAD